MDFSGNIRLRLPTDLHARLTEIADDCGISLNTLMVTLLAEGAARRGPGSGVPREVAGALAEAVLDSVHMPTRGGQLISRLDARHPEWRMCIPAERLAGVPRLPRHSSGGGD
jgi:hypothetical protein